MAGKCREFTYLNEITGKVQVENILNRERLSKQELDLILNCDDISASDFF